MISACFEIVAANDLSDDRKGLAEVRLLLVWLEIGPKYLAQFLSRYAIERVGGKNCAKAFNLPSWQRDGVATRVKQLKFAVEFKSPTSHKILVQSLHPERPELDHITLNYARILRCHYEKAS